MESYMLTEEGASWAIDRVEPMRVAAALAGVLKRLDGHVVVGLRHPSSWDEIYSKSFGDPIAWEHDYEDHAGCKAAICGQTGKWSREVIHLTPWFLEEGDSPWEGGVILDNIITAYSGAAGEHDEAIALAVNGWCRAWCFSQAVETGLWTPHRRNIGVTAPTN